MERLAADMVEGLLDRGVQPLVIARRADRESPLVRRIERLCLVNTRFVPGKLCDHYFTWRVGRIRRREGVDAVMAFHKVAGAEAVSFGGTHIGYLKAMGREPGFADRLHIELERREIREARRLAPSSEMIRRELIEYYGVQPEKAVVVYPPVDTARFRRIPPEERAALRARLGLRDGVTYFLFPSGGHERKGLPFLRRFFESTDLPVELLVAGRGVADGGRVRGLGYLRNIEEYYQAVDATVMASLYEPFGMVGPESVYCGTPAVLARNMACCEVMRAPALIAFEPGDLADLERAVREAIAFDREAHGDLAGSLGYDARRETFVDAMLNLL